MIGLRTCGQILPRNTEFFRKDEDYYFICLKLWIFITLTGKYTQPMSLTFFKPVVDHYCLIHINWGQRE